MLTWISQNFVFITYTNRKLFRKNLWGVGSTPPLSLVSERFMHALFCPGFQRNDLLSLTVIVTLMSGYIPPGKLFWASESWPPGHFLSNSPAPGPKMMIEFPRSGAKVSPRSKKLLLKLAKNPGFSQILSPCATFKNQILTPSKFLS